MTQCPSSTAGPADGGGRLVRRENRFSETRRTDGRVVWLSPQGMLPQAEMAGYCNTGNVNEHLAVALSLCVLEAGELRPMRGRAPKARVASGPPRPPARSPLSLMALTLSGSSSVLLLEYLTAIPKASPHRVSARTWPYIMMCQHSYSYVPRLLHGHPRLWG